MRSMESCRERKAVRGKGKTMWLSEALPQKSGHAGAKDAGKIPGRKKNGASEKFCPQMLRPENPGKKTAILWPEKQEKKAEEARAKTAAAMRRSGALAERSRIGRREYL